jgi:hypothetical protein
VIQATDHDRAIVGEFRPRDIRRGGTLRWAGHDLQLRPVSALRERYALRERGRDLAVLDGKSWGKRPVKITLPGPDAIEPGLLLFAAFVVQRLAANADSSAPGAAAAVSKARPGSGPQGCETPGTCTRHAPLADRRTLTLPTLLLSAQT